MHHARILTSWPLHRKLLLLLLVVFLPLAGIIIKTGQEQRRHEVEEAKDYALLMVQSLAAQQEQIAIGTKQMLSTLAALPAVQKLNTEACNELFRELNNRYPFYSTISAATPDGNLIAASAPFKPGTINLSDRKHIKDAIRTLDFSVGEYIVGRVSKVQSLNYTYPVLDANKNLIAIVIAGIKLDEYARFIAKANLPEGSAVGILDHAGVRLYRLPHSDETAPGKLVPEDSLIRVSGDLRDGTFERWGEDGIHRIYAFRQLLLREGSLPYLYMVVGMARDKILYKANLDLVKSLLILGIAAFIAMTLAWVLGNMVFVKPINRLVAATQRFGHGEMSARTGLPHSPDEVGQLAKSFDEMASLMEINSLERRKAVEALQEAHDELEERVDERTAELHKVNEQLQSELAERKLAEEMLRKSEEKYRLLVNEINDGFFMTDGQGIVTFANQALARIHGFDTPAELMGRCFLDFVAPWMRDEVERIFTEGVSGRGAPKRVEVAIVKEDGKVAHVEIRPTVVFQTDGRVVTHGVLRDVTERKRAEEALIQAEEKYRSIFDNAVEGIVQATPEGKFLSVNPAFAKMCGFENPEEMVTTITDIGTQLYANPEDRARIKVLYEGVGVVRNFETQYRRNDGRLIWVSINARTVRDEHGNVLYYEGIIEDITERKRAEEDRTRAEVQLRQTQKLEALGTLAGGIAHDFNNILGIIVGYCEMTLMDADNGNVARENVQEVLKAASRAKGLVQQILAFSRPSEQEKKPVQVGLIVKEASKMLRASLPSTIEIKQNVTSKSVVSADPTQIHQVLMNLCTNAAHAMRDEGGVLGVSLTDVRLEPESFLLHPDLQPGPYVELTIEDTGPGIELSILDRIFDPFFTTKEQGVGTGLGLSVVHGIVKSHGGAVKVESIPGKGATFHVFLPAMETAPVRAAVEITPLPRGRERVLLVEDELALGLVVKQMLEHLGYEVDYRPNGIEALEVFRNQSEEKPFDLVITDMTMPHLTGIDLSTELFKLHPDLPIVLCTGFSEKVDAEKARSLGIRGFLMKPVAVKQLAEVVRKALDKRHISHC